MISKKLALASVFVICMTILSGTAWADSIPIVNSSFQQISSPLYVSCGTGCAYNGGPIPGWTGGGGSWQPGGYFTSVPGGGPIGYLNATQSISQTLTGNSVLANSVYTLAVLVGDRLGDNGSYTLSLDTIVGGVTNTLCSFTGNSSSIPGGTFQFEGCTYTSSSTVPGGDLYLLLAANTGQLEVANVSLNVSVAEPSSVLLLAVGMLFLIATLMVRKRKEVLLTA